MSTVQQQARDLASFVTASPSPYHAVAEAVRRLSAAGFTAQAEDADWDPSPGGRYLVRDGTVVAWWQRSAPAPLRVFAAHTDSPGFKVKPYPDTGRAGWRQVGVEVYGGALWNSWLDRDLGLAGRLALCDGTVVPVRVDRPLLRIPQLAIHLDRSVNQGLTLDSQRHLLPIWGLGDVDDGDLLTFVAGVADVDPDEVGGHDLFVHDLTGPATLGRDDELLAAGRLDNLASVHAGITALVDAAGRDPETVPVFVGFDHEEIGSATATGAAGPLLETLLTQLAGGFDARGPVFARSRCLSVDVTHAAHPNYLERHDPDHLGVPNGGPSLKVNAVQRYATDAPGAAAWRRACRATGTPTQVFVSNNTVPCGTTVGPIMATRLGIRTVDVGIPVLSMHSARELCGVDDPRHLATAATEFLGTRDEVHDDDRARREDRDRVRRAGRRRRRARLRTPPAVTVTVGTYSYRSTVASMGGRFMVPLSAEHRAASGLAAGDEVEVDLELDTAPRELVVPDDLAAALDADPSARAAFDALSYSNRRRYTLAVDDAKTDATRQRRITKTVQELSTKDT